LTKALPPRSIPPAPADLSPESQGDWPGLDADVTVTLGAAALDFSMLADVLRGRDRLAQVRDVLGREGLTVTGSKGQTRPHPLLITESVLRREVADSSAPKSVGSPATRGSEAHAHRPAGRGGVPIRAVRTALDLRSKKSIHTRDAPRPAGPRRLAGALP